MPVLFRNRPLGPHLRLKFEALKRHNVVRLVRFQTFLLYLELKFQLIEFKTTLINLNFDTSCCINISDHLSPNLN